MDAIINGNSLISLSTILSVLGGLIYSVWKISRMDLIIDLTGGDLEKHKEEQGELNKEILKQLNEISRDLAVIKRTVTK